MNRSSIPSVYLCVFSLLSMGGTGCLRVAPKMPANLASPAPITYSKTSFDTDVASYRSLLAAGKLDAAKAQRNQIIYRVIAQIDAAYGGFEMNLSTRRAGIQTGGDAAQLGLSAAATVVGATEVKDILSATSTALEGTRLSFDKNFFEQKTTESLISQMRASRETLQAQILKSLSTRDVTSYPLEAAWIDVVNYYYAGTIPSALVDIASKAGSDAVAANQHLQAVVKELTPATPEQAQQAVSIRSEFQNLNTALASGDAGKVQAATDTLKKILTGAQISFDPTASGTALLSDLRQAMIQAADDDALLAKLNASVQSLSKP